jgi:Kinesin motor domain
LQEQNQKNIIRVLDTSSLVFDPEQDEDEFFFHGAKQTHRDITKRVKKKLTMEFDSVFDDEATNEDVFATCTRPCVTSVMGGFNCSVFVYGATGAGKTFTMLGSENNPGEKDLMETKEDPTVNLLDFFRHHISHNARTFHTNGRFGRRTTIRYRNFLS